MASIVMPYKNKGDWMNIKILIIVLIMSLLLPVSVGAIETEHEINRSLPSEDILITTIIADIALVLYVYFVDSENDTYYTNIIVGAFVVVLSLAISTMLTGGYITSVILAVNETNGTYSYDAYTVINHSAGIGLVFVLLALMMALHIVMVVVDMFRDLQEEKVDIGLN